MFEDTNLCGEAAVADGAFKRSLLGVAPVMYLQSGVAGERLVAEVTGRVAAHCTQINPSFNAVCCQLSLIVQQSERTITLFCYLLLKLLPLLALVVDFDVYSSAR